MAASLEGCVAVGHRRSRRSFGYISRGRKLCNMNVPLLIVRGNVAPALVRMHVTREVNPTLRKPVWIGKIVNGCRQEKVTRDR